MLIDRLRFDGEATALAEFSTIKIWPIERTIHLEELLKKFRHFPFSDFFHLRITSFSIESVN